ncbi:GNAT family protein [Spirosoma harenae]
MPTSVNLKDVRIETARLILREYRPSDLASIHDYASQPIVVRYQNWGPNDFADTEDFLQLTQATRQLNPRLVYELSIEQKSDGRQIGGCELAINEEDRSLAMIGYLINPLFWNQGYATEVSRSLLDFGVNFLAISTFRATCDSRNISSIRVLEKSGFRLEQILPDDFRQKGEMRTTCVYRYEIGAH